jgi:AraC-like DNA-binding protein
MPEKLLDHDTFLLLNRSREFIAENFSQKVTLGTAADVACMSQYHYHKLFSRAFKETPHEFMTRMRIEAAKKMLRESGTSVSEICLDVGYESLGSFSTLFARREGVPPSAFRRVFSMPQAWSYKVIPACFIRNYGLK